MSITPKELSEIIFPKKKDTDSQIEFGAEPLAAIKGYDGDNHNLVPQVIIAGAGTGKTTVMTAKIVWVVSNHGINPNQILGLSFTRKAVGEFRERAFNALLAARKDESVELGIPDICTYDSFAQRICNEYGILLGLDKNPTILTDAKAMELALDITRNSEDLADFKAQEKSISSIASGIVKLYNAAQSDLIPIVKLREISQEFCEFISGITTAQKFIDPVKNRIAWAKLVSQYAEIKNNLNLYSYADFTAMATRLTKDFPEIGMELRQRYQMVLVDEYQDTSTAQMKLLKNLFSMSSIARSESQPTKDFPITAVGDPYQAIYTWRGASTTNIKTFATDFPQIDGKPARKFTLSTNRRSHHAILALANNIVAKLADDTEGIKLKGAPETAAAIVHDAENVEICRYLDWDSQAADIANRIQRLKSENHVKTWDEIAVLCRKGRFGIDIYRKLTELNIPAQICGLAELIKVPEISDLLAIAKICLDPYDNKSALRLLLGSRWNINPKIILELYGQEMTDKLSVSAAENVSSQVAENLTTESRNNSSAIRKNLFLAEISQCVKAEKYLKHKSIFFKLYNYLHQNTDKQNNFYLPDVSPEIKEKLHAWTAEIIELSNYLNEPPLIFFQRAIRISGIDIELEINRLDNAKIQLSAFLENLSDYSAAEKGSLRDFLDYLNLVATYQDGFDKAEPIDLEAVQIMTCHQAKGLEWPAVFIPMLKNGEFPATRLGSGDNPLTSGATIPPKYRGDFLDFPQLSESISKTKELDEYAAEIRAYKEKEERRLAYVSITRAKKYLYLGSNFSDSLFAGKFDKEDSLSPYFREAEEALAEIQNRKPRFNYSDEDFYRTWEKDPKQNPENFNITYLAQVEDDDNKLVQEVPLSQPLIDVELISEIHTAAEMVKLPNPEIQLNYEEERQLAIWKAARINIESQLTAAEKRLRQVFLPPYLSVTEISNLDKNLEDTVLRLKRPMPQGISKAATLGTEFHEWVASRWPDLYPKAQLNLKISPELKELCDNFLESDFASRKPVAVEQSFSLALGHKIIRGIMDAVYQEKDGSYLVIDWKTGDLKYTSDFQLLVYRLAWAQLSKVAITKVKAGFLNISKLEYRELPAVDEEKTYQQLDSYLKVMKT